MINNLYNIAEELQRAIEHESNNQAVGTCYLSGHCLTMVFNQLGVKARKVSGKLAILKKNGKSKYVYYGRAPLKGQQIGVYHTWCEVTVNDIKYIVDTSLKANLNFIQTAFRIKIHPMVEKGIMITEIPKTYYYKYFEDKSLEKESEKSLRTLATNEQINRIINRTVNNVKNSNHKKSA
ncbi:hypothetical protein N9R06_00515 [Algibacter sp.]|nr:hypothetical protein [Algibacter sp.]